jgi:drug/metabolite transporter (DMT)-like permease
MSATDIEVNPRDRNFEGIMWMVVTGLCFAAVTGIVRYLGSSLPAVEAAFIRYFIGVLMMGPVLYRLLNFRPSAKLLGGFALRGLVHGFGVIFWFYSMARIPMSEVTAIGFTTPIFVTIGAAIFLGEKLKIHRIASVLIGFIGTLIILRPGLQEVSLGQLSQLAAAPLFAVSFLIAKQLTKHVSADVIVAMLSVMCTLVLLPGALIDWQTPTVNEVFWLAVTAGFATFGHFAITKALQAAPISVTQPISFLQLVWATLMGIVLFGEAIDPYVILGGGIIIISATYISHRETRGARNRITPLVNQTKQ